MLRSHENNYLAAVLPDGARTGLAYVDISTGEFRATEIDSGEASAAIETLGAREVLAPEGSREKAGLKTAGVEDRRGDLGVRGGLRHAKLVRSLSSLGTGRMRAGESSGWRHGGVGDPCTIFATRSVQLWIIWSGSGVLRSR